MFYAGFRLGLCEAPKFLRIKGQHDFFCIEPSWPVLPPHKFFSIQLSWSNYWDIVEASIDLDFKGQDHAGLKIDFKVLGLFFVFNIYDHRHWDYDNDCWEEPGAPIKESRKFFPYTGPNNVIVPLEPNGDEP